MSILNFVLLMQPQAEGSSPLTSFLPLVLIVVVFYFFIIRPQMKRQKEVKKFREGIAKGDKVVTTGGIMGKIYDVKDDHLVIEIADNVRVKVDKNSVVREAADLSQKK